MADTGSDVLGETVVHGGVTQAELAGCTLTLVRRTGTSCEIPAAVLRSKIMRPMILLGNDEPTTKSLLRFRLVNRTLRVRAVEDMGSRIAHLASFLKSIWCLLRILFLACLVATE